MTKRLHIGGEVRVDGWEVLNAQPGSHVDHVSDASVLPFADESLEEIYASHVLEHVRELPHVVLAEWYRALEPNGTLYVSVPDLEYLCRLFLSVNNVKDKIKITQIMYGGHIDDFDYHVIGYDETMLTTVLQTSGFGSVSRVNSFGLFQDCSELTVNNKPVSVNMIARKGVQEVLIDNSTAL